MSPVQSANDITMEARRKIAREQRKSPEEMIRYRLIFRPNGEEHWLPKLTPAAQAANKAPAEIWIRLFEPTDQNHAGPVGQLPEWDFAAWLERVLPLWASQRIDLYMTSFGSSFLKPDFFDKFQILAGRELRWTTHFLTDGQPLTSTATLDALLRSSLNELQVYVTNLGDSTINTRVLEAVKDLVDLRKGRRQNHPDIICRVCPGPGSGSELIRELSLWVRQTGVDRLEVTDKVTEEKRLWGL